MITFKSWRSFYIFSILVKRKYRYIQANETKEFLDALLETSKDKEIILKEGEKLYRSQTGYDEIEEYNKEGIQTGIIDLPYKASRMIPDEGNSRNGRANPYGIPCLYLSDDFETALSEARPWIKERISVAVFKAKRNLRIIDFSNLKSSNHFYFEEPDKEKIEKEVWSSVNQAFSEPVNVDDQDKDYIPTQIISELFKSKGFDGIKYKSMLASGNNYALFNLEDAIPINGVVFQVRNINYQFEQYSNPVNYSIDGSDTRTFNKIAKFMPAKK